MTIRFRRDINPISPIAKQPKKSGKPPAAKTSPNPVAAMIRPPPPGEGKRGEKGHLAYLLRQAQAAARLTIERAEHASCERKMHGTQCGQG